MANTTVPTPAPAPRRRRRWPKILAGIVIVIIVLIVAAWFVCTSSAFFKGVVLPRASKELNANITVSEASISPFSQVVLRDLKVQPTGQEALLTAPEVRLRYNLTDIMRGNIHVDEVLLSSATINWVTESNGVSNLDPILSALAKPSKPSKPSKPAQIDIREVAIKQATIRQTTIYPGGQRDVKEIAPLDLTLTGLKNGQTGKLALSAAVHIQNNPPPPGTNALLDAKLDGKFDLVLSQDLKPATIQGSTRLDVTKADGAYAQAAALVGNLDCNVTPTEIKQVALTFQRNGTTLGQIRASGPFDMEKSEGRITVEVANIDKNLLNIAAASMGIDFGPTTIASTNEIQLAKGGAMITAAGQFNLNQFELIRTNQATPPLDLRADYNVTYDKSASNALLRTFTLNGTQKGQTVLHGELSSPMQIALGNVSNALGNSTLNLTVNHLDLADWKPFLGTIAPAGDLSTKIQLISQEGGRQLNFDLNSEIKNLTAVSGTNQISQLAVSMQLRGEASDMKTFKLPAYKLQVAHLNQPLATATGSGSFDQANADVQLNAQLMLAPLSQLEPSPDLNVSSGNADLKLHLTEQAQPGGAGRAASPGPTKVSGSFALANFSAQAGSNTFRDFGFTADYDVGMTPEQVQIHKLAGQLLQGHDQGGNFDLTGTYNLTNKAAQLTAKLAGFNQAGLGPFLEPMLSGKKLVSIALNGNAALQYDPNASSALKADLQVTNLVVNDPTGQVPATPLEARFQADASIAKQIAAIRQFVISLTPTDRASNQVQLAGQVDMSQTNAYQGNLKLTADSLDVTRYYDIFVGSAGTAATSKPAPETRGQAVRAPSTGAAPSRASEQEPEGMRLPFRNFTADASIQRFYLREVQITNLQTAVKLDGGNVTINPFKLALNGAPMVANVALDLSVPGYKYNTTFNANAIPLAPLVNSFQPERKGQVGGTLTAQANFTGEGTSGASLQKNLAGKFDFFSTNLNLKVVDIKSPILKLLVNVVSSLPEISRNPASALQSLGSQITGGGGAAASSGGLSGFLQRSPINSIVLRGTAGSGKIDLQQGLVQSPAFQAETKGPVTLAEVLTNSAIYFPVSLALERSAAQSIHLAAADIPTNAPYAVLPDFLTITGTVGKPEKKINTTVLAETVARTAGGFVGGNAGQLLRGLGNLGGSQGGTNQSTGGLLRGLGNFGGQQGGTNQPTGRGGGLLQNFLGGSSTATNAPSTNKSINKLENLFR
ncbi:MAG: hypothetical protein C5B50_16475 [Verrucomicrobia bacterium]|nr:MAG: hypothetical protein C5B50_16475 [Verrucomicrobiota bacterium]